MISRNQNFLAILGASLLIFTFPVVAEQMGQDWVARYDGYNSSDYFCKLVVDDNGFVYVAGVSSGPNMEDFAVIKYWPNGDTAWVRRHNGPGNGSDFANDLSVDGDGNVYVTGGAQGVGTSLDITTIKYSPAGEILWIKSYQGFGSGYDYATDVEVDESGNTYVTGSSYNSGGNSDVTTIKYSPSGDTLWVRHYDGPDQGDDGAYDLAIDQSGYIYVGGNSIGLSTSDDYLVIKYDPNGDTVWVRRFDWTGSGADYFSALTVDQAGNAFLTGRSYIIGAGGDFVTIKYSPIGDTLWARYYDGPANEQDIPTGLAADANGNVYVTGFSRGVGTNDDFATIKYSPNGDTLWVRRYNGPGNGQDYANFLNVDSGGNVYVTGFSWSLDTQEDYTTVKYSANGALEWELFYDGPAHGQDEAYAVAVSEDGNVYVTGRSIADAVLYAHDFLTLKYVPCVGIPGDANNSNGLSLADAIAGVNYIFNNPGFPPCSSNSNLCWLSDLVCRGDWNGNGTVSLADVIQSVNNIFNKPGGPWDPVAIGACCLSL